jgi:hypothetical protein
MGKKAERRSRGSKPARKERNTHTKARTKKSSGRHRTTYTDIIYLGDVCGVKIGVTKGDILRADGVKVLPTNEFFDLNDSDWESHAPRSVIGQYLKRLSVEDRDALQNTIKMKLGISARSRRVGMPFGHTIVVKCREDTLLLTNTVKYDVERIKRSLHNAWLEKEGVPGYRSERLWYAFGEDLSRESRVGNHYIQAEQLTHARNRVETLIYLDEVHYDTCLIAIGQCVENIVRETQANQLERIAIPLLGAGWGGLESRAVFETLVKYLRKSVSVMTAPPSVLGMAAAVGFPRRIDLYLPRTRSLDRTFVLHCFEEQSLYDEAKGETLRVMEILRFYENELAAVTDRIRKYKNLHQRPPGFLLERKQDVERRIESIKSLRSSYKETRS